MTQARRSKTFVALPESSRAARGFVVGWLNQRNLASLTDRASLSVSELTANAVLHTGQPFTVRIQLLGDVVRIDVVDSFPDRLPMRVPTSGSAVDITSLSTTGRGLQIVSAVANRWGIALDSNLKTVWCEFDHDAPAYASDPVMVDDRPSSPRLEGLQRFRFIGLPVRTAIASGLEVEDAIRDLQLQPRGAAGDGAELLSLVDRSASIRLPGRHAAMHAASQNRLSFDLEIEATDDAFAATAELNDALAKRVGGRRPPSADVVDFRAWLVDEIVRHRGGAPPTPHPTAPPSADGLWVLDAASQRVFAEDVMPVLRESGHVRGVELRFVSSDVPDAVRVVISTPDDNRAEDLVRALQQTLIPPALPVLPGLDVAAAYHPAHGEVGGDFYDLFEVADGDWCAVLGDVSGKGIEAAIVTAAARHAVRSAALREPVPSGLMRALNGALVKEPGSRFCTVALLRLVRSHGTWVATLTSGGHPFPLLVRHGTVTKLGRPGSLVGVFDDVAFHDVSIRLAAGDALVLYTDGVTEARNAEGEFFGEEKMFAAIAGAAHSAQAIVDAVVGSVVDFQAGAADDIALVVVRRP